MKKLLKIMIYLEIIMCRDGTFFRGGGGGGGHRNFLKFTAGGGGGGFGSKANNI